MLRRYLQKSYYRALNNNLSVKLETRYFASSGSSSGSNTSQQQSSDSNNLFSNKGKSADNPAMSQNPSMSQQQEQRNRGQLNQDVKDDNQTSESQKQYSKSMLHKSGTDDNEFSKKNLKDSQKHMKQYGQDETDRIEQNQQIIEEMSDKDSQQSFRNQNDQTQGSTTNKDYNQGYSQGVLDKNFTGEYTGTQSSSSSGSGEQQEEKQDQKMYQKGQEYKERSGHEWKSPQDLQQFQGDPSKLKDMKSNPDFAKKQEDSAQAKILKNTTSPQDQDKSQNKSLKSDQHPNASQDQKDSFTQRSGEQSFKQNTQQPSSQQKNQQQYHQKTDSMEQQKERLREEHEREKASFATQTGTRKFSSNINMNQNFDPSSDTKAEPRKLDQNRINKTQAGTSVGSGVDYGDQIQYQNEAVKSKIAQDLAKDNVRSPDMEELGRDVNIDQGKLDKHEQKAYGGYGQSSATPKGQGHNTIDVSGQQKNVGKVEPRKNFSTTIKNEKGSTKQKVEMSGGGGHSGDHRDQADREDTSGQIHSDKKTSQNWDSYIWGDQSSQNQTKDSGVNKTMQNKKKGKEQDNGKNQFLV
eukprot:403360105